MVSYSSPTWPLLGKPAPALNTVWLWSLSSLTEGAGGTEKQCAGRAVLTGEDHPPLCGQPVPREAPGHLYLWGQDRTNGKYSQGQQAYSLTLY